MGCKHPYTGDRKEPPREQTVNDRMTHECGMISLLVADLRLTDVTRCKRAISG